MVVESKVKMGENPWQLGYLLTELVGEYEATWWGSN